VTSQVLTTLLSATDRLIKPYAHSLINVFLPKARDPQPVVSRPMIESIGLLGCVAGEDLVPFVDEILPLLINALQDPQASNKKKEATLRALSRVCAHTGSVVDPLIQYPELFGVFRKFLVGDKVGIEMKRKVLQAMGVLGAVDPYTRKVRFVRLVDRVELGGDLARSHSHSVYRTLDLRRPSRLRVSRTRDNEYTTKGDVPPEPHVTGDGEVVGLEDGGCGVETLLDGL